MTKKNKLMNEQFKTVLVHTLTRNIQVTNVDYLTSELEINITK